MSKVEEYTVDGEVFRVAFERRSYGPGHTYTWVCLVGQLPIPIEWGSGAIHTAMFDPFPKVRPSKAEVADLIRAFVAHNRAGGHAYHWQQGGEIRGDERRAA